jgi:NitT/TauT family transport system substrate-binding protein
MQWIRARDPEDYAELLGATFPNLPLSILIAAARTYIAHGMWTTPRIDPAAYLRWQQGIVAGHLAAAPIPYEQLIDPMPTNRWQ